MTLFLILAQAAGAAAPLATPAPVQAPPQAAVVSYPPAFFADIRPSTAFDMVSRLPGFTLDVGDSVRGFEGAAGNVLINGQRPASKSDALDEALRRVPASEVERIDVIRGGAPGIDMQGKSVLANVIRKSHGTRGLLAIANFWVGDSRSAEPGVRAEASGDQGGRPWDISLRYATGVDDGAGDGPGFVRHADGSPTEISDIGAEADGQTYIGAGSYELPLVGGRLKLNGRLYSDKFKNEEIDKVLAPAAYLQTQTNTQLTHDTETGGRFTRGLGPKTGVELVALHTTHKLRIDYDFKTPGEQDLFNIRRHSSESIARGVLKRTLTSTLSAELGAETAVNKLDSGTRLSVNGAPVAVPAGDVAVREDRSEAFVKATWRPLAAWTFDGAVRYETSDISSAGDVVLDKSLKFWKPRVAAAWTPTDSTQVRLRFERTVGQLNFDDFVATASFTTASGVAAGNPDLDPEQAWVSEAAIEQKLFGATLVTTLRHSALKDAIDRGPVVTASGDIFDRPANIGAGRKDELILELTAPLDAIGLRGAQLKGDLTQRWSKVTDPATGRRREISGLRPQEWNLNFTQSVTRLRLNFGIDVYGGWRETYYRYNLVDNVKVRPYLKPFVEWKPRTDLVLRVEATNITKRNLRETIYVYPGSRGASGAPDIQDRNLEFPRGLWMRMQKTF